MSDSTNNFERNQTSGSIAGSPPLSGVRVVDFGHYIAAPLAAMLLADQGAEVVHICPPDGETFAHPVNYVLSRNKKILRLDLKSADGKAKARRLISAADVVVENFRPGGMERLGLGKAEMTAENRGLIYLSLPGFASTDEEMANIPAWEGVIAAATGFYTETNPLRRLLGLAPVYTALPLPSVYAAIHGAIAVVMALIARRRDPNGAGDCLEVPLASAAMSAMGASFLHLARQPRRYDAPPLPGLIKKSLPAMRKFFGSLAQPTQNKIARRAAVLMLPLMDSYVCADGKRLYIFAIDHRRLSAQMLDAFGLLEKSKAAGLRETDAYQSDGGADNLSDAGTLSLKWKRFLRRELTEKIKHKSAPEWETLLTAVNVPCAVQRSTGEWLDQPFALASGLLRDVSEQNGKSRRQPGVLAWFEANEPAEIKAGVEVAPNYEWRRRETSSGSHFHLNDVETSGKIGKLPLDGIKILDLSSMVAGPVCARTLGEYGAEVIKIESPKPLHGPRMTCWYGLDVNQGKRSILLDLKTSDGRKVIERMLRETDVLVHNFRSAALPGLAIDFAAARQINPRIIYTNVTAFDGQIEGEWTGRAGYDPVLQAATGVMRRFGSESAPELHAIASCVDYLTGYAAAFGTALAIYSQQTNQRAVAVKTSLAMGAEYAQLPFMQKIAGAEASPDALEAHGQAALGTTARHRLYRAADGWFFLGAGVKELKNLCAALEFTANLEDLAVDGETARKLEIIFAQGKVADWLELLRRHDCGAAAAIDSDELRRRYSRPATESNFLGSIAVVRNDEHPAGTAVETIISNYVRSRRWRLKAHSPAVKPGGDMRRILRETGETPNSIEQLLQNGAAAVELAADYLPE